MSWVTLRQYGEIVVVVRHGYHSGNTFTVLEGRLSVSVEGYKPAELYTGDTVYVPKQSHFSYHSNAHFTKVI